MDSNITDLLNPDIVRPRLTAAAVYIAAFEYVKDYVTDQPRNFFCPVGTSEREAYHKHVLSLDKDTPHSPIRGSLNWFVENGALGPDDMKAYKRLKKYRDDLSHGLFSMLSTGGLPSGYESNFDDLIALLRKVSLWWIKEVDMPCNKDYDGVQIEDNLISGPETGLRLLRTLALGSEEESRRYLDLWQSAFARLNEPGGSFTK